MENQGFAVIPRVLGEEDIAPVSVALEGNRPSRSKAGVRHLLADPLVSALADDARLLQLASSMLGSKVSPFRATLFDKSPAVNWLIAWHQDTALPLMEKREVAGWGPWSTKEGVLYAHAPAAALEQVAALRVQLDDSNEDNGPLRVLPATHRLGVLSDDEIHELAEKKEAVDCLVPRGGVIAMRPLLIHSSSKSRSEIPRRVLHIEYACARSLSEGLTLAVV